MRPILPSLGPQMRPQVQPAPMPAGNPAYAPRPVMGVGQVQPGVIGSGLMSAPSNGGGMPVQQASAQPMPAQVQAPMGTANTQPINPILPTIRR